MTVSVKALVFDTVLPSSLSGTPLYTSTNVTTIIDKCTVTNFGAASATFTVYLSTSASDNNIVIKAKTLQPNETYTCPEVVGQVLNSAQTLNATSDTVSSMNIRVSGRQVS